MTISAAESFVTQAPSAEPVLTGLQTLGLVGALTAVVLAVGFYRAYNSPGGRAIRSRHRNLNG